MPSLSSSCLPRSAFDNFQITYARATAIVKTIINKNDDFIFKRVSSDRMSWEKYKWIVKSFHCCGQFIRDNPLFYQKSLAILIKEFALVFDDSGYRACPDRETVAKYYTNVKWNEKIVPDSEKKHELIQPDLLTRS